MKHARTLDEAAHEVRLRIGRGSKVSLKTWFTRGCPERNAEGLYDVDAICEWANEQQQQREQASKGQRDWHQQLAKQRALKTRLERLEHQRKLVPVEFISELLACFGIELGSQLDQLTHSVLGIVKPKTCDRTLLKAKLQTCGDHCRRSLANAIDEWESFVTGSLEHADNLPEASDHEIESGTRIGSSKASTSRGRSVRTQDFTDGTALNTGKGLSKQRKAARRNKSS